MAQKENKRSVGSIAKLRPLGDPFHPAPSSSTRITADGSILKRKPRLGHPDEFHYGHCRDCGRKIPAARLSINPDAVRCVKCQDIHEREALA